MPRRLVRIPLLVLLLAGCSTAPSEGCPEGYECAGVGNIIGGLDWIDVADLPVGAARRAASAMGELTTWGGRCSAVLVDRDLLVTNHHCVPDAAEATGARFYPVTGTGVSDGERMAGSFACPELVATDCSHDVSLLRCEPHPDSGRLPGDVHGFAPLALDEPLAGQQIFVLHANCDQLADPGCAPAKLYSPGLVASNGPECVTFPGDAPCDNCRSDAPQVRHTADTLGGSSGGGLFDAASGRLVGVNWGGTVGDGGMNLASTLGHLADSNPEFGPLLEALAEADPGSPLDPPPVRPASLSFGADWQVDQAGTLLSGGALEVDYDLARLEGCVDGQASLHGRLHPSGSLLEQPLVAGEGLAAAAVALEEGASSLELWFSRQGAGDDCPTWDSDLGSNYHFGLHGPPDWLGAPVVALSASEGHPCAAAGPLGRGFVYDPVARAAEAPVRICFEVWEPGVTDHDNGSLWQQLDVSLLHRFGGAYSEVPVAFVDRVGNNARYALDLSGLDPFADGCPDLELQPLGEVVRARSEFFFRVNGVDLTADGFAFEGDFEAPSELCDE